MPEWMDALLGNQFFSAGFGLVGVGTGLALLRTGLKHGTTLARRYLLVTLEIASKDRSYEWVLQWITARGRRSTQHLSLETNFQQHESGQITTRYSFVPSPGNHWIPYGRAWIHVNRQREKNVIDLRSGTPWETVTLTTLGRNPAIFQGILDEAHRLAMSQQEGRTVIYTSYGTEWRPFGQPRRRRPIDSVLLQEGVAERITGDVNEFLNSSQWYIDRGIPYRRGYLLHGPPGSGKSSFITALAGKIMYNICILSLSERGLTDDRLNHLMCVAPPRSIILLEDIDAAFVKRDAKTAEYSVTFSGLLNTLDGVGSTEERVVFMTTNHVDRLDPALIRPGRVDMIVELGHATTKQIRGMFAKFYPGLTGDDADAADRFAVSLEGSSISMAQLQGFLMFFKNDPSAALRESYRLWPRDEQDQARARLAAVMESAQRAYASHSEVGRISDIAATHPKPHTKTHEEHGDKAHVQKETPLSRTDSAANQPADR